MNEENTPGAKRLVEIFQTERFASWLQGLRDRSAVSRIQVRIDRLRAGNYGDVKALGLGLLELRISYGPGYRIYFIQRGEAIIVLLAGGDKGSQQADIKLAQTLAEEIRKHWPWG